MRKKESPSSQQKLEKRVQELENFENKLKHEKEREDRINHISVITSFFFAIILFLIISNVIIFESSGKMDTSNTKVVCNYIESKDVVFVPVTVKVDEKEPFENKFLIFIIDRLFGIFDYYSLYFIDKSDNVDYSVSSNILIREDVNEKLKLGEVRSGESYSMLVLVKTKFKDCPPTISDTQNYEFGYQFKIPNKALIFTIVVYTLILNGLGFFKKILELIIK